ncbi:uncharacterized protein CDV56_103385 [Aspergillus thermomutatus]|uniref:Uncharacterized protein n=1 Tax=Aspergillus thermomutatus TaxID=41047 RepID=A0A397G626_ASPTH|nr:uncharacterized protein CDV56_103385 [Aspergillus thermomutatus]RHZ46472.1 hypothetical protein CDV56_103385 [Aspergillus thermomutatus]
MSDPVPNADFGCYISVQNNLPVDLVYFNKEDTHGYWDKEPPYRINPTAKGEISLKDKTLAPGAEGWFEYRIDIPGMETTIFRCNFKCPVSEDNGFSWGLNNLDFMFDVSNTPWSKSGHPLNVTVTIGLKDIQTRPNITQLLVPNPTAPVLNSAGVVVGASQPVVIWTPQIAQSVQDNTMRTVNGSFQAVAVQSEQMSSTIQVDLASSGDANIDKIPVALRGILNGAVVFESGVGRFNSRIDCTMLQKPNCDAGPFGWAGDMTWQVVLQPKKQAVETSATTRIEIYAVTNETTDAQFFKTTSVPIGLLRRVVLRTTGNYVAFLADTLFRDFGYLYDALGSLPSGTAFGTASSGGNLQITKWAKRANSGYPQFLVCYDTAALAQVGLAFYSGNVAYAWVYMDPFGYINDTQLIGWGQCNSPFFKDPEDKFKQDINDVSRQGFGNHAFVAVPRTNAIIDSCCGPHIGNEDLNSFISQSVDTKTALYHGSFRAGTPNDATKLQGIMTLDTPANISLRLADLPNSVQESIKLAMELARVEGAPSVTFTNSSLLKIPELVSTVLPGDSSVSVERDIGPVRSHLEWTFTSVPEKTTYTVTMVVNQTHEEALTAMHHQLCRYPRNPVEIFRAVPQDRAYGQYALESVKERTCSMWIRGNIFAVITAEDFEHRQDANALFRTYDIVDKIHAHLQHGEVDGPGYKAPAPPDLSGVPQTVKVGGEFSITASAEHVAQVASTVQNGNVFPVKTDQDNKVFTFVGRKLGPDVVTLSFADATTYAVTSTTIEITVEE